MCRVKQHKDVLLGQKVSCAHLATHLSFNFVKNTILGFGDFKSVGKHFIICGGWREDTKTQQSTYNFGSKQNLQHSFKNTSPIQITRRH